MIVSLDEQIEREVRNAEFISALREGRERFAQYRSSVPFIERSYSRTCLMRNDAFELVAMQWAPGSLSPIHDHGDSRCWVVILEGALDIDNYDRLDDLSGPHADVKHASSMHLTAGQLDHRYNRRELHKVRNTGEQSTYSLQLYAAPLTHYITVDESTGLCGRLEAAYEATHLLH